jgi:hypothetical protein
MVSKASIWNTMCLSHHVGVQVWPNMVQTSNPSKYILHEIFGYTKNSCVLGRCMWFIMCFALQCHNVCVLPHGWNCAMIWFKVLLKNGFTWPSIHWIGWMGVTNSYTVSTSVLPFALVLSCKRRFGRMCHEALWAFHGFRAVWLSDFIAQYWHWAVQCHVYYWVEEEEEVETPSPKPHPSKRFLADLYNPQKHQVWTSVLLALYKFQ